jgi:hypothetical protein
LSNIEILVSDKRSRFNRKRQSIALVHTFLLKARFKATLSVRVAMNSAYAPPARE